MKQNFDNVGFAQVQARVIALPSAELHMELTLLRTDPSGWILANFELTASQQQQLASLPPAFLSEIANGVADVFEQRGTVNFFKQEHAQARDGREDRDGKDILYRPTPQKMYSFDQEELDENLEISIWIT